jgi:hypothetical protein
MRQTDRHVRITTSNLAWSNARDTYTRVRIKALKDKPKFSDVTCQSRDCSTTALSGPPSHFWTLISKHKSQNTVMAPVSLKPEFLNFKDLRDSSALLAVALCSHITTSCNTLLHSPSTLGSPMLLDSFILKMRAIRFVEKSAASHTTIHRHIQEGSRPGR